MARKSSQESKAVIGENSMVRLGLVVVVVGALIGSVVASVWWASAITTKMDAMQGMLTTLVANNSANKNSIDELNARVKLIETAGTPKAILLERELSELKRVIDMHMATTKIPTP